MTEYETTDELLDAMFVNLRKVSRETYDEIMKMKKPGDVGLIKAIKCRDRLVGRARIVEHLLESLSEFDGVTESEGSQLWDIKEKLDALWEHYELRIAELDLRLGYPRCGNCKHRDKCTRELGNEIGDYVREEYLRDYGHCNLWGSRKE